MSMRIWNEAARIIGAKITEAYLEDATFEDTIDLKEFNGIYRKPEPHEDIHHPDYFDALKERAIDLKRNIS
jgi:hypothetical protein